MIDGEYTLVSGLDFNVTGIDAPKNQEWDLDYCCEDHYCMSSARRRWGGGWWAGIGLGLVVALAVV
jgi:hypothetical protein